MTVHVTVCVAAIHESAFVHAWIRFWIRVILFKSDVTGPSPVNVSVGKATEVRHAPSLGTLALVECCYLLLFVCANYDENIMGFGSVSVCL